MEVLYRGFDGLDVSFEGRIPEAFEAVLERAKEDAVAAMRPTLISYEGVKMHVEESGARGGYAFRCDTGPDGATWFFKRNNTGKRDDWGVRVSVKSLALALYGFDGVRDGLYQFMAALGIDVPPGAESVGRVDYAVDILAPDFVLVPDNFVMHSHTNRRDHTEPEPLVRHGTSGRVTSVTNGMMPNRQIIVYDKRKEVIASRKVHWPEIWNARLQSMGMPPLELKDRKKSTVWRVEIRAGKDHLRKSWSSKKWVDVDNRLGDLLLAMVDAIRYTVPTQDSNRSRWANHSIWDLVRDEIEGDLFEMMCGLEPNAVKEVLRREHVDMLNAQIRGLAASCAAAMGISLSDANKVPGMVAGMLREFVREQPIAFEKKMARAADRYVFFDTADYEDGRSDEYV